MASSYGSILAPGIIRKHIVESGPYYMDFAARLADGETLASSPTCIEVDEDESPKSSALVIGDASISGTKVIANVSVGVLTQLHFLRYSVVTSTGRTIAATGRLKVPNYAGT